MVGLVTLAEIAVVVDILTHATVLRRCSHHSSIIIGRHIGVGKHACAKVGWVSGTCVPVRERSAKVIVLRAVVKLPTRHWRRLHCRQTRSRGYDIHLEAPSAFCAPAMADIWVGAGINGQAVRVGAFDEIFSTVGFVALLDVALWAIAFLLVDDCGLAAVAAKVVIVIVMRLVERIFGRGMGRRRFSIRGLGICIRRAIPWQRVRPDICRVDRSILREHHVHISSRRRVVGAVVVHYLELPGESLAVCNPHERHDTRQSSWRQYKKCMRMNAYPSSAWNGVAPIRSSQRSWDEFRGGNQRSRPNPSRLLSEAVG